MTTAASVFLIGLYFIVIGVLAWWDWRDQQ